MTPASRFPSKELVASGTEPLPLIEDDEDLLPLLRQASNEELDPLVKYIVDSDVVSGKGADRILRVPERDHQEMCGIALYAAQRAGPIVAGGRAVVWNSDGAHQVQVLVAFEAGGRAMPDSSDQTSIYGLSDNPVL